MKLIRSSKSKKEAGDKIENEFNLDNEHKVIEGVGVVVRIVSPEAETGESPGWGIKFTNLDEESRRNLDEIVTHLRG